MNVVITRDEAFKLLDFIKSNSDKRYSKVFTFALARAKSKITPELEAYQASITLPDGYETYDQKRAELLSEYMIPTATPGKMQIKDLNKVDEFNNKFVQLTTEYAEVIKAYEELTKQLEVILQEKIELDLTVVSPEHLPEELSLEDLDVLSPIID